MTAKSLPKDPQGITLGNWNQFTVGRLLGEGAQGGVYVLFTRNKATGEVAESLDWVVKATLLPPTVPAKKSRKPLSEAQIHANSLYGESLRYQVNFPSLRGTVIPNNPSMSLTTTLIDRDGFRFLILERMEGSLEDSIQSWATHPDPSLLGQVAVRLVDMVRQLHDKGWILADVKLDNIMLCRAQPGKPQDLPARLRLVDLGLLQEFWDPTTKRHVLPKQLPDFVGTPLYASLRAHQRWNLSRHDDLEGLLYVIAEVAIRQNSQVQGTTDQYTKDSIPSYLPWSLEQSDDAVGQVKNDMVRDRQSLFYQRMPDATADILYETLHMMLEARFESAPAYEALQQKLELLTVAHPPPPVAARRATQNKKAPPKKKTAAKAPPPAVKPAPVRAALPAATGQKTAAAAAVTKKNTLDPSGPRMSTRSRRETTLAATLAQPPALNGPEGVRDMEMELPVTAAAAAVTKKNTLDPSGPRMSTRNRREHTVAAPVAQPAATNGPESVRDMEVELPVDENLRPASGNVRGLGLIFVAGPNEGQSFQLIANVSSCAVLGSNPKSRSKDTQLILVEGANPSHARLKVLVRTKFQCSVQVENLKGEQPTQIDRQAPLAPGEIQMAYAGSRIQLGESVLLVVPLLE